MTAPNRANLERTSNFLETDSCAEWGSSALLGLSDSNDPLIESSPLLPFIADDFDYSPFRSEDPSDPLALPIDVQPSSESDPQGGSIQSAQLFLQVLDARPSQPKWAVGSSGFASSASTDEGGYLSLDAQVNDDRSSASRRSSGRQRRVRDSDCRFARDFVSAVDRSQGRDKSSPPILLKGSQEDHDCLNAVLKLGFGKRDLNGSLWCEPSLAALEVGAELLYQSLKPQPPEYAKLTGASRLCIPDLDGRLDMDSNETLAAIVRRHDAHHGGSHRVGVVEETGQFDGKIPIYNIAVIPDGRYPDESSLIIWLYRSKEVDEQTGRIRWSTISPSSGGRIFCEEPDCYRGFHDQRTLENHCRQVHPTTLPSCDRCTRSFKSDKDLNRHKKTTHERDENAMWHCNECDHKSHRKDNVWRHVKTMYAAGKHQSREYHRGWSSRVSASSQSASTL